MFQNNQQGLFQNKQQPVQQTGSLFFNQQQQQQPQLNLGGTQPTLNLGGQSQQQPQPTFGQSIQTQPNLFQPQQQQMGFSFGANQQQFQFQQQVQQIELQATDLVAQASGQLVSKDASQQVIHLDIRRNQKAREFFEKSLTLSAANQFSKKYILDVFPGDQNKQYVDFISQYQRAFQTQEQQLTQVKDQIKHFDEQKLSLYKNVEKFGIDCYKIDHSLNQAQLTLNQISLKLTDFQQIASQFSQFFNQLQKGQISDMISSPSIFLLRTLNEMNTTMDKLKSKIEEIEEILRLYYTRTNLYTAEGQTNSVNQWDLDDDEESDYGKQFEFLLKLIQQIFVYYRTVSSLVQKTGLYLDSFKRQIALRYYGDNIEQLNSDIKKYQSKQANHIRIKKNALEKLIQHARDNQDKIEFNLKQGVEEGQQQKNVSLIFLKQQPSTIFTK